MLINSLDLSEPTVLTALAIHLIFSWVLIGAVAVFLRLNRRWNARSRHRLLQVCTLVLLLGLGAGFIPEKARESVAVSVNTVSTEIDKPIQSIPLMKSDGSAASANPNSFDRPRQDPAVVSAAPVSQSSPVDYRTVTLVVLCALASVTLLLLVRLGLRYYQMARINRQGKQIADNVIVKQISTRYLSGRFPRIKVHEAVTTPITVGLFKPAVLLPPGFIEKIQDQQHQAILLHELGHVARRDNLDQLLSELTAAVFWFNPAVYWLLNEQATERECACDDFARQSGINRKDYSLCLLRLAEDQSAKSNASLALGISPGRRLYKRIHAMLHSNRSHHSRLSLFNAQIIAAIALISMTCLVLATPKLRLVNPQPTDIAESFEPPISRGWEPALRQAIGSGDPSQVQYVLSNTTIDRSVLERTEIDNVAKINQGNKRHFDPLRMAINLDTPEIFELLLDHGFRWDSTETAVNILTEVAAARSPEILDRLITLGATPDGDGLYNTPIRRAIGAVNLESLELLIARGAKVNLETPAPPQEGYFIGYSPLLHAIAKDRANLTNTLIAAGADINRESTVRSEYYNFNHYTPLIAALENGRTEQAKILLDHGADPNKGVWTTLADGNTVFVTPVLAAELHQVRFKDRQPLETILKAGGAHDPRSPDLDEYIKALQALNDNLPLTYDLVGEPYRAIIANLEQKYPHIGSDRFMPQVNGTLKRLNKDYYYVSTFLNRERISPTRTQGMNFQCEKKPETGLEWDCVARFETNDIKLPNWPDPIVVIGAIDEPKLPQIVDFAVENLDPALLQLITPSDIREIDVYASRKIASDPYEGSGYEVQIGFLAPVGEPIYTIHVVQIKDEGDRLALHSRSDFRPRLAGSQRSQR